MFPHRRLRGISALLLALAAGQASAGAALAFSRGAPHACEDHACFCRKPAAGSPVAPCHGEADEDAPRLVAACNHDVDPATLSANRPGLLPPPVLAPATGGSRPLPHASGEPPADGFPPIESPPPRPHRLPRA